MTPNFGYTILGFGSGGVPFSTEGGTVTTHGSYTAHTFISSGNFPDSSRWKRLGISLILERFPLAPNRTNVELVLINKLSFSFHRVTTKGISHN